MPCLRCRKGFACCWSRTIPQVREFAEGLLADLGCEVVSAESAEQALERLASNGIDLVVTDVVMPGMSGVELARRIRETHPDVPVLLATGYSDEIVKRGSEFSVLAKPFGAARPQQGDGGAAQRE